MLRAIYTAEARVTGGRADGRGRTTDGQLDLALRMPTELGGQRDGANPEQLLAIGWAACFEPTLGLCPYSKATRGNIDLRLTVNGRLLD